jgi:hypothetical protein
VRNVFVSAGGALVVKLAVRVRNLVEAGFGGGDLHQHLADRPDVVGFRTGVATGARVRAKKRQGNTCHLALSG